MAAAHGLARQLVRNRSEADDVVAETFAKILDLLHRGGGPDDAFRPYLLTAVRRAAYDRHRAERRQLVTDEMEAFDRGVPFADPAVAPGRGPGSGQPPRHAAEGPAPTQLCHGTTRRDHRCHPISPSHTPSTHQRPSCTHAPAPRVPAAYAARWWCWRCAGPSRGACCARPRRHNVLEPRFEYVLAQ